jgi:mono/diheme cytochrome c family protein
VAAQVGSITRHGHHVAGPGVDLAVAARAQVRLGRLVGLHEPQVDVVVGLARARIAAHDQPKNAQSTSAAHTTSAAPTNSASATGEERWGLKGFMPMTASMLRRMVARHLRRATAVAALVVALGLLTACSQDEAPAVPEGADGTQDPVLVEGRDVWSDSCARCHGSSGGGGSGPKLADGAAADAYPDPADMEAVIADGKDAMPAFGGSLTPEQIAAVTAYVRDVL